MPETVKSCLTLEVLAERIEGLRMLIESNDRRYSETRMQDQVALVKVATDRRDVWGWLFGGLSLAVAIVAVILSRSPS